MIVIFDDNVRSAFSIEPFEFQYEYLLISKIAKGLGIVRLGFIIMLTPFLQK